MKRLLFIFCVLTFSNAFAQNAKVVSAFNYKNSGEYAKALESIEPATTHEKTMTAEKTWRYRGEIYNLIAMSEEPIIPKDKALTEALASYKKALELDKKGSYEKENTEGYKLAAALAVNGGIEAYNEQQYEKSRDMFLLGGKALEEINIFDTLAYYNGGLAAEQAGDFDTAIKMYEKCIDANYLGEKMYLYTANVYNKKEDKEGYLDVIKRGRAAYPEDADLIVYELNYYLMNGKFEEAENNLKLAIEKEPNNKQLYFSLGVVYDNLGNTEQAVKAYEDAIAIDAEYFDALYNLGALYFNKGVEMNNEANNIQDNKKYAAAREEAKQVFIKSKPFLEKAHQLDESDMGAMQSLSQLYALLNETEKYQEMKDKLEKAAK